jgi:flavin reductase (DIM6/NTAB) family NADH-FMN oxidoreductase RutF
MDKINLGSTIPAYPMPVSLVGTHVDGKPNFMAVAWFTMASYKPPRIAIALGQGHYTNPGIIAELYRVKKPINRRSLIFSMGS